MKGLKADACLLSEYQCILCEQTHPLVERKKLRAVRRLPPAGYALSIFYSESSEDCACTASACPTERLLQQNCTKLSLLLFFRINN